MAEPQPELAMQADSPTTSRVVRGLSAMVNQRGGIMIMRLQPPELGQLRVQMTMMRGVVEARFEPATAMAQALLDRNLPSLRAALEGHGLAVERLTVQAPPPQQPSSSSAEDGLWAQQRLADHRHDAADGRSRGRQDEPDRFPRRRPPPGAPADFSGRLNALDASQVHQQPAASWS